MAIRIHNSNGYMGLTVWVLNNVIQLATESFCDRFLNLQNVSLPCDSDSHMPWRMMIR
ncbi:MAG: hypothetical protein KBT33_00245 [Prevotellaceae bacterium]|nr:hypothetical protein [Candidatus Minthosoma equi]